MLASQRTLLTYYALMKLLFGLLLVIGGYYLALCQLTNLAVGQLTNIQHAYGTVAATADKWQQGDTSTSFVPKH
ncbi:MAG TPA: hypothetical protein VN031_00155 [Candidatus Microsaccharimonas sp.]|nr:hypothetical protein [Candidatus Microsaccharimonas sp.]